MKNIWKIFQSDMVKIATSWVTLVIVCGVIVLPPLYAWINIYASWDPYSNTKGIKVAVVNQDAGANLKGIEFDIGAELISTLKTNDKMGWIFCEDADQSLKMLENSDIYASIIIPEDFSRRMTTIIDPKPMKPSIEYYVNEKSNAIAPKMTDSVANLLQKQVTSSIIETAVQKAFEKFNQVGYDLDSKYPDIQKYMDMLFVLNRDFPNTSQKLDALIEKAENGFVKLDTLSEDSAFLLDLFDKTVDFNDNFSESLLNIDARIKEYSPEIRENLQTARNTFLNISSAVGSLAGDVTEAKPELISQIGDTLDDLDSLETKIKDIGREMTEFNDSELPEISNAMKDISNDIADLRQLLKNVRDITNKDTVRRELSSLANLASTLSRNIGDLENAVNRAFKIPLDLLNRVENEFIKLEELIGQLEGAEDIKALQEKIDARIQALAALNEELKQNSSLYRSIVSMQEEIIEKLKKLPGAGQLQNALDSLKGSKRTLSSYIENVRIRIDGKRRDIQNSLNSLQNAAWQLRQFCRDLSGSLSTASQSAFPVLDNAMRQLDSLEQTLRENSGLLMDSQNDNKDKIVTRTSEVLEKTGKLRDGLSRLKENTEDKDTLETLLYDTQNLTFRIQSSLDTMTDSLDDDILPRIEKYLQNGSLFIGDVNQALENGKDGVEELRSFLREVSEKGRVSTGQLERIKEKLPQIQSAISKVADKVDEVNKTIGLSEIVNFLKSDAGLESDFAASPVKLTTHRVYPMANYGTGLTPFYTVLALWVGALFMPALFTTNAKNANFLFTPRQEFFGKYLVFAVIALAQGLIAALGDLFLLKVSVQEPVLFVFLAMFYSLLFCMMVYTLVATLHNVGKALAIIFMLLQLTGSGGTFPIQVTPPFFQTIHAMLPFTYAISGMREAIFGVVFHTLMKDIGILLVFFVAATLVGVLLKKPLNQFMAKFSKQLSHSGITEH